MGGRHCRVVGVMGPQAGRQEGRILARPPKHRCPGCKLLMPPVCASSPAAPTSWRESEWRRGGIWTRRTGHLPNVGQGMFWSQQCKRIHAEQAAGSRQQPAALPLSQAQWRDNKRRAGFRCCSYRTERPSRRGATITHSPTPNLVARSGVCWGCWGGETEPGS